MTALVDVDAAAKLAHWGLLSQLAGLLGRAPGDFAALTSLRFRAERRLASGKEDRVFPSEDAARQVLDFLATCCAMPAVQPVAALQDVPDIDPGEAVMISAALQSAETLIITGDKRALRAIARLDASITGSLAGRIVCVEQILLLALEAYGLERLRTHVCRPPRTDKSALVIMGSRCDASESSVRDALESYIRELKDLADPCLLWTGPGAG